MSEIGENQANYGELSMRFLQSVLHWAKSTSIAQISVVSTAIIGLLTLLTIFSAALARVHACFLEREDRRVFAFMKASKPASRFYAVAGIPKALDTEPRAVFASLLRLAHQNHVKTTDIGESATGLWGLHETEQ